MARFRGFWALVLATPHQGRAIPCRALTRASRTVAELQDSRNLNHWRVFDTLKDLLGERPLVLDRGFSYLEGLRYLLAGQVLRDSFESRHPPTRVLGHREAGSLVGGWTRRNGDSPQGALQDERKAAPNRCG